MGNWTYHRSNNTIKFESNSYTYEIDLDQKLSPEKWVEHLMGKREELIPMSSILDMIKLFEKLGFTVDQEQVWSLVHAWDGKRN